MAVNMDELARGRSRAAGNDVPLRNPGAVQKAIGWRHDTNGTADVFLTPAEAAQILAG
jgi:hypothetical protein